MLSEIVKKALWNLNVYRKRSLMTIIGVAWGIASFILLIAYGDGFQRAMNLGLSSATKVLLILVGFFTLAVAGVGIMNIMLFTVQERTREIGLLKALGAKRWQIRLQFLSEAIAMSFMGGLLGYILAAI